MRKKFDFKKLTLAVPVILLLILTAATFALSSRGRSKEPKETIKIGAVYPLTGQFASYGIEYQRGLEMAEEEINSRGGVDGRPLDVIFEDDAGDVSKSVTAVNKLISTDHVKYLLTAFSANSLATAPIAEQNQVLYMSATVSKIGTGKYIFRDSWDMEDNGAATGAAVKQEGIKKLGILALNYADTKAFMSGLKSTANTEFKEEQFNFGDTDFKTQLTKIKQSGSDAILIYSFPGAEATKIMQQITELKMDNLKLFSGNTTFGFPFMYQPMAQTLAKMKAIDAWYSLDSANAKSNEFATKYKQKYNQDLIGDAAYPYDDLYALTEAIKNKGSNALTLNIADELRGTEHDGAAGKLTFDDKGNSKRQTYLQQFTEKGWVKYNTK